ncbi:MAG: 2Fe-2S iron-sulfur cluster-binding protein [Lamprobacter sp.]|uniref:2Fe-2S iron-sulfur cluster-binding protein n=1 Tax=Lamprobacter sp. TaxID=3100796 RepID=UPI002B2575F1|nr:2Fe-2S iron-sulfur cluster-binding protein [Lamprobacter sp.]MEA3638559.1 2Fe-2S iron-sulfur cluster-binding protein [Lamprobacter sp.]
MTQLLSLSRAARLAGVTRAEIQKRIRQGEMQTFEGQVAISDLLHVYPSVSLEKTGDLERVEQIKADALPRSHDEDTRLPSQEVLVSRIRSLAKALVQRIARVDKLEALMDEIEQRLDALAGGEIKPAQARAQTRTQAQSQAQELKTWLRERRAALGEEAVEAAQTQLLAKDTFLRIMSASVKMIPSGHEFFVDGNESILEAAVRSGLRLNYGCANGNCGECKVRLVSGEVYRIREHDYVLSEREKQLGYLLSCSHTAVTDIQLEAAEAHSPADLPEQEIQAQIRKLEPQGDGLMLVHVQTPRTNTLRFMAGQRARLRLADGVEQELPIASCPCNGRNLLFSVRPGSNAFSTAVFERLRPRDPVTLTGPYGDFVLAEDATEPAVFIALDDGIAPVKSLIEHAVSIDSIEAFHLYWSVPAMQMHYHQPWCRALRDTLDNFAYTPLVEAACADLLALLESDLEDLATARYYVAGPTSAITAVAEALLKAGIPKERIASEGLD